MQLFQRFVFFLFMVTVWRFVGAVSLFLGIKFELLRIGFGCVGHRLRFLVCFTGKLYLKSSLVCLRFIVLVLFYRRIITGSNNCALKINATD